MIFLRCIAPALFAAMSLAAQQSQTGTVAGTIFDANTAQPVRQVTVEIEGFPDKKQTSDVDGKFRVELPPGSYKLRFMAEDYSPTTIDAVAVTAGEVTEASTVMTNNAM